MIIKTVYDNQHEILQAIRKLFLKGGRIECDVTYSSGSFYRGIPKPKYRYDISPKSPDVVEADCRDLPLTDDCVGSLMYDPPFLATKGPSLAKKKGNIMANRFSVFPDERSLHQFFTDSLIEFQRVLKEDGILIVKCQDKVSSGTQYFSHCYIYNEAVQAGFYPLDLFILTASHRLIGQNADNQKHARKFHSYFWVFRKCNKVVKYRER